MVSSAIVVVMDDLTCSAHPAHRICRQQSEACWLDGAESASSPNCLKTATIPKPDISRRATLLPARLLQYRPKSSSCLMWENMLWSWPQDAACPGAHDDSITSDQKRNGDDADPGTASLWPRGRWAEADVTSSYSSTKSRTLFQYRQLQNHAQPSRSYATPPRTCERQRTFCVDACCKCRDVTQANP